MSSTPTPQTLGTLDRDGSRIVLAAIAEQQRLTLARIAARDDADRARALGALGPLHRARRAARPGGPISADNTTIAGHTVADTATLEALARELDAIIDDGRDPRLYFAAQDLLDTLILIARPAAPAPRDWQLLLPYLDAVPDRAALIASVATGRA